MNKPARDKASGIRQRLRQWFTGPVGELVCSAERDLMDKLMPDLFGYHALQLGRCATGDYLQSSRVGHKAVVSLQSDDLRAEGDSMVCSAQALPLASDSVDVLLLVHVIEFESDPYQVLREVDRVLVGEGHAVILAFNPLSAWGLWRMLLAWRDEPPWCGRFVSRGRMRDWLKVLGLEVTTLRHACFRPPVGNQRISRRLAFLEKLGGYWFPWLGGVYCLVARKRLTPVTPARMQWRQRRAIMGGVAEPTARVGGQGKMYREGQ